MVNITKFYEKPTLKHQFFITAIAVICFEVKYLNYYVLKSKQFKIY